MNNGLSFARKLGFTDAQYAEAEKLIGNLSCNANRLVAALIDVSARSQSNQDQANCQKLPSSQQKHPDHDNGSGLLPTVSEADTRSLASNSSSCYSSMTSVRPTPPDTLRKIFIDGPNVARTHGKDANFSWMGIKICVDWFLAREHRVKVFVPSDRCNLADPTIIEYLNEHDALIKTPTGCNDDLFVIEAAKQSNAIIVSNDHFRDESRFNNEVENFIYSHRLPYIFVDDLFIPAKDPLGRAGPNLDEFLKLDSFHSKLTRTKSHQRNAPPPMRQHRKLQASRSLPLQAAAAPATKEYNNRTPLCRQ